MLAPPPSARLIVFSTTFRYALISLLELAESPETLQASAIARKFDLSSHYLSVVLRELRRLGLIESHRGNRGGYRLACAAEQVNLFDLYRSLAGSTPGGIAEPAPAGSMGADAWLRWVGERWTGELAATTLADLRSWASSPPA